jgi:hypothetical protein
VTAGPLNLFTPPKSRRYPGSTNCICRLPVVLSSTGSGWNTSQRSLKPCLALSKP